MTDETLYKCLGENRQPRNGGKGQWKPGAWMPAVGVDPCYSGYHLCRAEDILAWLGPEIWEAKGRGKRVDCADKIVFSEARLVRKFKTWNQKTQRLFAADCAERVLHLFEELFPDDNRPRVARMFAKGKVSRLDLEAARAAAWDARAAWDAAREAWETERAWQTERLFQYLKGELT